MRTVQFGKPSTQPTPYAVAPPLDAVFTAPTKRQKRMFLPILTVDLSCVRSDWEGVLHFIYYEVGAGRELRFRVRDAKYEYEGDYGECDAALRGVEGPWKTGHVELVGVSVPERHEPWTVDPSVESMANRIWDDSSRWANIKSEYKYWETLDAMAKAIDPALSTEMMFGGEPRWTQSDETPLGEDGKPMQFIGQLKASALSESLVDYDMFLFFSREERSVVQIVQVT